VSTKKGVKTLIFFLTAAKQATSKQKKATQKKEAFTQIHLLYTHTHTPQI
jgi:hypothetical protein